jgi:hypothetical protein
MTLIWRKIVALFASVACTLALTIAPAYSVAQTEAHKKKAEPKPEPTSQELFEYIRGGLIEYSPNDRVNDNLEVSIDPTATILTVKQPDGHCDIFLGSLDANTITWDVYDASDSMQTRAPLARMNIFSIPGKKARTCYDNDNNVDPSVPTTHVRLLFSWDKIPDGSGFQAKMTKAIKKLIKMCGGYAEKDIFKNP